MLEGLLASLVQFSYQKDLEKIGLVMFHASREKEIQYYRSRPLQHSLWSSGLLAWLVWACQHWTLVLHRAVPDCSFISSIHLLVFYTRSSSYLPQVWSCLQRQQRNRATQHLKSTSGTGSNRPLATSVVSALLLCSVLALPESKKKKKILFPFPL